MIRVNKRTVREITKGRKITLPKNICDDLGVDEHDQVVIEVENNRLVIRPFSQYGVKDE